jgi:hypothetical protein
MNTKSSDQSANIPKEQNIDYSPPWDPYRAMGYSFFVSWIISGVVLGLNWRRLGKPNWLFPTAIISFIIQATAVALMILWIVSFRTVETMPKLFLFYVPSLMAGIIFAVPLTLAKMQNGPYKLYKKEGRKGLADYTYNLFDSITYGILLSIIIGIVFLLGFVLLNSGK